MFGLAIVVISTTLSILTGIAVLTLNWRRTANILYGFTSLSFISLGVANFLSTQATGGEKLLLARLVMALTCVSLVLTYYLVVVLIKQQRQSSRQKLSLSQSVAVFATVVVVGLCMTPLVIREAEGAQLIFGAGISMFALFMGLFTFGVLKVLLSAMTTHTASNQIKSQAKYLMFGFLPIVFLAPITGVYLPAVQGDLRFIDLTPAYSAMFVLMVGYAMIKYSLFDIRLYVVRAIGYILTSLSLGIVYIAPAVFILGTFILGYPFELPNFILAVLIATLIAYNFNRIRVWFDAKTNRIFYRDSYDPAILLSELNRTLVSTIDLKKALKGSALLVSKHLKTDHCSFVINETTDVPIRTFGNAKVALSEHDNRILLAELSSIKDKVVVTDYLPADRNRLHDLLSSNDIAMVVRLSSKSGRKDTSMGVMLLGYKKSGNSYTEQDVRTLGSIANVLIIAIQNALRFEEIEGFNVRLQAEVNAATRQLRQTNIRLKELDSTKDDFISMASHQLRTPLTSVKGYVSMVLEGDAGKINDMQRNMLEQAFISTQRMTFLIADLLNLSRLKTGKFVIEPVPTNLAELAEQEVNQLKDTAKARNLTVVFDKPESFPVLLLDETKTRQVIMNFIDNAIYYTPTGGSIEVAVHETDHAVEYTVTDTGIGVPKSIQHHLFTKFYRADNAKRARPDGTGLGLFMAKKVIVAQGGAIIFKSVEGQGSTFGFSFPKDKTHLAEVKTQA